MIIPTSPFLVFFSALIFSLGITSGWPNHIAMSLFYIVATSSVAALLIYAILKKSASINITSIALLTLCNHLAIILGYFVALGQDHMLWPADTIDHHLPNAIAFSEWLSGDETIEIVSDNPFKKIYFSNMWVGTYFSIFGISPIGSALAMLTIKLITVVLIYFASFNFIKDKSVASIAAIIYGLLPTITFYTIQFYKDFFIHFLVALIFFVLSKSISRPKFAIFLALPMAVLFLERFYLLIMISLSLVLYFWGEKGRLKLKMAILFLSGLISLKVLDYYFSGQGINELIETIRAFESAQNESTDVTPTTNIFLDLFRIAFTPFFNLHKLDNYKYFDSILIFGGFIHQLVMLFYFRGLWLARRTRVVFLNFAFLLLLIILALIMPYDGRARDSFYPFVSFFAAVGIASLSRRKKRLFADYFRGTSKSFSSRPKRQKAVAHHYQAEPRGENNSFSPLGDRALS